MTTIAVPRDTAPLSVHAQSAESWLIDRADDWDRLSGGIPFRQTMWMRPLWRHLTRSKQIWFLAVVDTDDRVRGILPLERCAASGWQTARGWQTMGAAPCTDHVSILCQESDRHRVAAAIAAFLIGQVDDPKLGWDFLHFEGVVAGEPAVSALIRELDQFRASVRIESRMSVWFRSSEETWDQFLNRRSRKHRHRLRLLLRQLDCVENLIRIEFPQDEVELVNYLNELIRLHQVHWTSMGEPGSYAADGMIDFIRDSAREAFQRDRLFFPVLIQTDATTGRETVLAAQIHFIGDDGRLYCYSSGVNYDYGARKPGNLLNAFVLRHAHQHQFVGIDFLRGDEEYKSRIYAEPTPLLDLDVFAPTPTGWLNRTRHDAWCAVKQIYRRLRHRQLTVSYGIDDAFDQRFQANLPIQVDPIGTNHVKPDRCDDTPVIHRIGEFAVS